VEGGIQVEQKERKTSKKKGLYLTGFKSGKPEKKKEKKGSQDQAVMLLTKPFGEQANRGWEKRKNTFGTKK